MAISDEDFQAAVKRLERIENKILAMEQEGGANPKQIKELQDQVETLKKFIEKKGGETPPAVTEKPTPPVPPLPPKEKGIVEWLGED